LAFCAQRNDFPDCLACGSLRTREHHFRQEWCRGTKSWTAESLCLDCHCFSWRAYTCAAAADPVASCAALTRRPFSL